MKRVLSVIFLLAIAANAFAAKIDTVYIMSKAMHKMVPNIIITPLQYQYQDKPIHFPVLYLLHGATGNYRSWLNIEPDLGKYADQYNIIIVCPDGGYTSWYFDSPIDTTMKYETYVARELVGYMDSVYHSISDRSGRAIAGLSMGGHGAFYLSFRHPEIWGAAGSMSGGVDIRPFPKSWEIAKRLGTLAEHPDNWEKNTVINMLDLLQGKTLNLIFDCGVDDFFYEVNKKLHAEMVRRKIPHDYIERPGEHNAEYWNNALKYQLVYFNDYFERNKPSIIKK